MIFMLVLFVSVSAISAEPTADETLTADIMDDAASDENLAVDYYVSNDGSDDNSGTIDSPYKTIGKAIEKSEVNKTTNIHLKDGVYQQEGNVNLTMQSNINLIGSSVDKTILDGSNTDWLIKMNSGKLMIKDLTIQNFFLAINKDGTNAGIITSDSEVDIDDVIIADNIIQTSLGQGEEKSTIYTGVIFSTGQIAINNVTGFNNRINNTLGTTLADLRTLADWGCVIGSFNATTINNSNFYNNYGSRSSVVYAHTLTTLDIANSRFENNTATYSGGVFLSYLNTTTHISNSYFKNNNGTNAGGIIYQQRYCNMFVDDCVFEDNYANTGGSLYAHHYSNLTATNCSFSTGRARTGSAIIGADFVILTITDCKFENNVASEGAIMGDEGCQINVDHCTFNNNSATFGAAVFGDMINNITVKNSILTNNVATYGGAIFGTFETNIRIINNTFSANNAVNGSVVFVDNTGKLDEEPETQAYEGITSAIYCQDNIFTNNTSEDGLLIVNYETVNSHELKDTKIIASDISVTVDASKKQKVTITLKDKDGNALSSKDVNIVLNGVIYAEKTNENGISTVNTVFSKVGTFDYVVCFDGDNNYKSSIATAKIKVNKKSTSIVLPKKATYKAKAKNKYYSITLKGEGKALAKKQVTIKVNKKTYTAKTNAKGVAKFNVKITKKGTYKVNVNFKGDSIYNAASKAGKIIIK